MKKNIFDKYPENLQSEYNSSISTLKDIFDVDDIKKWNQEIKNITDSGVRSWEITTDMLKISVSLSQILSGSALIQWAQMINKLIVLSPVLASSYISNSNSFLNITKGRHIDSMALLVEKIYDGSWKSGNFAAKVLDHSSKFLKVLTFSEFEQIIYLLNDITKQSFDMAVECLDNSYNFLTRFNSKLTGIEFLVNFKNNSSRDLKNIIENSPKHLVKFNDGQRIQLMNLVLSIIRQGGHSSNSVMDDVAIPFNSINNKNYDKIFELCKDLSVKQPKVITGFLSVVPDILGKIDVSKIDEWYEEGIELLSTNADAGIAYFKLESLTSENSLNKISSSVEYESIKELLQLYCSALAGDDLEILPSTDLVEKNIGWSSTMNPTTEGKSIFVPEMINRFDDKLSNYKWFKVISSHQVGRLEFGSFKFNFDTPSILFDDMRLDLYKDFVKKSKLAEKIHFPLEDSDDNIEPKSDITKTDFNKFFDLFENRKLISDVFAIVEDTRIEQNIKRKYMGLSLDFENVKSQALLTRPNVNTLNAQDALVEFLVQISLGKTDKTKVPKKYVDEYKKIFSLMKLIFDNAEATVHDSCEISIRVYKLIFAIQNQNMDDEETEELNLDQEKQEEYYEDDNLLQEILQFMMNQDSMDIHSDSEDYDSPEQVDYRGDFKPELVQLLENMRSSDGDDTEFSQENMSPEMLKELLEQMENLDMDASESPIDSSTDMIAENILKEISSELSENSQHNPGETDNDSEDFQELQTDDPQSYVYDEWDFRSNDYKPRWCIVKERTMGEGDKQFYDDTLLDYSVLVSHLRRQFEMISPEMLKKVNRLEDGEEFDIDDVIEAFVDIRSGVSPSEKLYWRRNKIQRDVACVFLLDVSASTAESIEDSSTNNDWDVPDDPVDYMKWVKSRRKSGIVRTYKRIIDVEKEASVLIIDALENLGDQYGIYCFSGYGRENVEFYTVKDIDESLNDNIKSRIDKISPLHATRMGPAIRHAISKLDKIQSRTKLLFLISDGRPQDRGYSREGVEKEYAVHDTKMALTEAKNKDINAFCLTVDKNGHDYLKTMTQDLGYEVLDDVKDLPERLLDLYRNMTM
ncbi:MAG: nitric oxide reductase activation protein NorD [Dehalococcoidia bacterium]